MGKLPPQDDPSPLPHRAPQHAPVISYFVTSFIPEPQASTLAALASRLPPGITPNPASRMHLTYRSFDGLPPGLLQPLKTALRGIAATQAPFTFTISGWGRFAGGALWARGVANPGGDYPVMTLQRRFDEALERLGLPAASHEFVPHVTLGQDAAASRAPRWLEGIRLVIPIHSICLTTTGNAEYRVVTRIRLEGG